MLKERRKKDEGIGSTRALKQALSFLTVVAYFNGGSSIGTISPKPIVDNDISAEYDF